MVFTNFGSGLENLGISLWKIHFPLLLDEEGVGERGLGEVSSQSRPRLFPRIMMDQAKQDNCEVNLNKEMNFDGFTQKNWKLGFWSRPEPKVERVDLSHTSS